MPQKVSELMCVGGPYCGEMMEVPQNDFKVDLDNGTYWRTGMNMVFTTYRRKNGKPIDIWLWQQPMY